MNYQLIVLFVVMGFVTGCAVKKPVVMERTVTDTVTIKETVQVRDTVIVADSAKATVIIKQCEDITTEPIQAKSKQATVKVYKDKATGQIKADCECDTLAIKAQVQDKIKTEVRVKTVTDTKIVEKKFVPFVVKLLAWIGGILSGGIIVMLLIKKAIP